MEATIKVKFLVLPLLLLTILVLSGCISSVDATGRLRHRDVEVKLSPLDWIEVAYFPVDGDPIFTSPCRLSLFGAGEIVFKTGRSPMLWNSFSDKVSDPQWNDLFIDRLHLSSEEMQSVFQAFVDEGLIPKYGLKRKKVGQTKPYVNITAQIGMDKIRTATDNTYLVDLVEDALDNFRPVILRAAAAQRSETGGG